MKTFVSKKAEMKTDWFVLDATDLVLGRLATKVVTLLYGKHKTTYSPNNLGDKVVVTNCSKIKITGRKRAQKMYYRHSGYAGGLTEIPFEKAFSQDCRFVVEKAIMRMMNNNPQRRMLMRNLYLYQDNEHKHQAQNPQEIKL